MYPSYVKKSMARFFVIFPKMSVWKFLKNVASAESEKPHFLTFKNILKITQAKYQKSHATGSSHQIGDDCVEIWELYLENCRSSDFRVEKQCFEIIAFKHFLSYFSQKHVKMANFDIFLIFFTSSLVFQHSMTIKWICGQETSAKSPKKTSNPRKKVSADTNFHSFSVSLCWF